MKKISSFFISVVLHHYCRSHNNKDAKIRSMYSKLVLFNPYDAGEGKKRPHNL
jgi:hypothetical protein